MLDLPAPLAPVTSKDPPRGTSHGSLIATPRRDRVARCYLPLDQHEVQPLSHRRSATVNEFGQGGVTISKTMPVAEWVDTLSSTSLVDEALNNFSNGPNRQKREPDRAYVNIPHNYLIPKRNERKCVKEN